jgi:hypothetical protein
MSKEAGFKESLCVRGCTLILFTDTSHSALTDMNETICF